MQVLYMDKWIASINCLLFTLHKTFEKGKFRKYKDKISKRNDDNLHFIFKGIVFKPILGHLQIFQLIAKSEESFRNFGKFVVG